MRQQREGKADRTESYRAVVLDTEESHLVPAGEKKLRQLLASPSLQVVRDLTECGVNTLLVAYCWLGVYLWSRGRDIAGGVSLGLAMALKCTPALFWVYFLWKRQWRMAVATAVAAVAFKV